MLRSVHGITHGCHALALLGLVIGLSGCRSMSSVGGYTFDFGGVQAKRSETGGIRATVKTVEVDNRFGTVQVRRAPAEDFRWNWNLIVWASTDVEASTWSEQIALSHQEQGEAAAWRLQLPRDAVGLRGVQSDLTLFVPEGVRVRVGNRGDVEIAEVQGETEVRNEHGNVRIVDCAGFSQVLNAHGNVSLERVGTAVVESSHGTAQIQSILGDVQLTGHHADLQIMGVQGAVRVDGHHKDLHVADVAGPLHVRHEHGDVELVGGASTVHVTCEHGNLNVDTIADELTGDVEHGWAELVLRNSDLRQLDFKSEHGDVRLSVPLSLGGLRASVEHGRIESEVPLVDQSHVSLRAEHGDLHVRYLPQ